MKMRFIQFISLFILIIILSSCSRPIADFSYQGNKLEAPAEIVFENKSQKAETYEWDFGDGNFSSAEVPKHEYKSSGNYLVILKARKGKKERSVEKRIVIDAPEACLVEVKTEFGDMIIELSEATPQHRDNFNKLVEEGFYDGLLFHRVIDGFMIQGGDPNSKKAKAGQPLGSGGPGYTIPAEFVDSLMHVKGALAAARTSDGVNPEKRSSGSQFYIVQGKEVTDDMLNRLEAQKRIRYTKVQREAYLNYGGTPFLDREYTVFGRVIKGLDVIDKITSVKTDSRNRPEKNIILKMEVIK